MATLIHLLPFRPLPPYPQVQGEFLYMLGEKARKPIVIEKYAVGFKVSDEVLSGDYPGLGIVVGRKEKPGDPA